MNTRKIVSILLVVIVLLGVAFFLDNQRGGVSLENQVHNTKGENPVSNKNTDETVAKKHGNYLNYDTIDISKLEGKIVLDFSATWCPTCQSLKKDINENLSDIPENVNIVVVDYDTHPQLKKRYGIRTQHSFVQVDKGGNEITKWIGGSTLGDVLSKVK